MDELELLIIARLQAALDHLAGMGTYAPEEPCGLASGGPDEPVIRLSMQDVARIAGQVARDWF